MSTKKSRILELNIKDFLGVNAVDITHDGGPVVLSGGNGQGKSSVLKAIMTALAARPPEVKEPVRDGKERAEIRVDIGDYVVVWKAAKGKPERIQLETKDGAVVRRPREALSKIVGRVSFDPMSILGMKATELRDTLLELAGVDVAEFDRREQEAYDARRDAKRDADRERLLLDALCTNADAPDREISTADLHEEMSRAISEGKAFAELESERDKAAHELDEANLRRGDYLAKLREAEGAVERASEEYRRRVEIAVAAEKALKEKEQELAKAAAPPDIEGIQHRMREAETINYKVQQRREWLEQKAAADEAEALRQKLDAKVNKIRDERATALAAARMPIDGLEIRRVDDGDSVMLNGVPFQQANSAAKIEACVAIGAALSPAFRVALVECGNDLDDHSMEQLIQACARRNIDLWIERIQPHGNSSIIIEDGSVQGGGDA